MKKINKPQARKLFNQGYEITLVRNKCSYDSIFKCKALINSDFNSLDHYIKYFEYYNSDPELGTRTHFYV